MSAPAPATTHFPIAALRDAIERLDAPALLAFYADDAVVISINHDTPPRMPMQIVGRARIADHLRDICTSGATAQVDRLVVDGTGAAYLVTFDYPDGTRTVCATLLDLRDGKITRDVGVQAWSAASDGS